MIKKVMAMVLILTLAVSMTACGNSNITAAGAESREKITLGINDWPGETVSGNGGWQLIS